jgi:hypothetical protein
VAVYPERNNPTGASIGDTSAVAADHAGYMYFIVPDG